MSTAGGRRTVQEKLGVSLNASALRMEASEPNAETALQRVAALGAAVLHIRHGADRGGPGGHGGPVAALGPQHQPDPRDQVAGELASALNRIREAGQHGYVQQAIEIFAVHIGQRERFGPRGILASMPTGARYELLVRFATRSLHEWLSDRCMACGKTGRQERSPSGAWVRPLGRMARNSTFRTCEHCNGSGRPVPSHTARRVALGISIQQYEQQGWGQHFRASFTWLEAVSKRLNRPLTVQLERSKKRV